MKVLITGAAGQVGLALKASTPAGVEVHATDREQLDITDALAVADTVAQFQPNLIINAAAYTAVDKAESEAGLASAINESGPLKLAEAASNSGARLIHISTDFVFDGAASRPYSPEALPSPLGIYGASKLAGEQAVLSVLPESAIVLRTAWVYSATNSNFLLTMLRLMGERGAVRVVADQIGTPTTAQSIAEAIWALAAKDGLHGIYHWTNAGVASWYDFAVAISEEAAALGLLREPAEVLPIATEDYPTPAQRPAYSVLNTSATVDAIGIQPAHWRASLRAVLGELKNG